VIFVYVLMALFGAALAVFALENLDPVVIQFLNWRRGMPLAAVMLLSLVAGLSLAALVGLIQYLKLRRRIRQLEAQLVRFETAATRSELPSDHGFR
jgi:putative membrane protein